MSLPTSQVYGSIDYGEMGSSMDYRKVLALRLKAYTSIGRVATGFTARDMADEFDEHSRILTASHQGEIVGSVRLNIPNKRDDLSLARYFARIPGGLPPRGDFVEAAWMCVDPSFRGKGNAIFEHLIARMVGVTIASGRRYIVAGAAGRWIDYWQKFGFERLDVTYADAECGGIEHELIVLDTKRPMGDHR